MSKSVNLVDQLMKPPKKNKGLNIRTFNRYNPGENAQADTLYMPHHGKYKYILTVVDIGPPRITDAEPLKTKEGQEILNAFKKIYKRGILNIPKKIDFDNGTEFNLVQKWFEDQGVGVKRAKPFRHSQMAMVERRNQIIGTDLHKRMLKQELLTGHTSREWVDDLPIVIENMNQKERKKKIKPVEKNPIPQCEGDTCELIPEGTKVRVALDNPIDPVSNKKLHGKFRSADIKWTINPRTVKTVYLIPGQPPMYLLDDPKSHDGIDHSVSYTKNQLMPISEKEVLPTHHDIRPIIDDGIEKYIVDSILEKKKINNRIFYKVAWKGYPIEQATWEPRTVLIKDIPELVGDFERLRQ